MNAIDSKRKKNSNILDVQTTAIKKGLSNFKVRASIMTRIRAIGNSKGVILSNQIVEAAGLNVDSEIVIEAADGVIYILQAKAAETNTDLSTWDKQFKSAIKKGAKSESDLFNGMDNEFDSKEW